MSIDMLEEEFDSDLVSRKARRAVLSFVSAEMARLGASPRPDERLVILRDDALGPMCSRLSSETCLILLANEGGRICQFAYQLAHEYCHWLIGGSLRGRLEGLFWLEETICELSSLYHLRRLADVWSVLMVEWREYPVALRGYYEEEIRGTEALPLPLSGYIGLHLAELSTPAYDRCKYRTMALALLPQYESHPRLWGLLPYFGSLADCLTVEEWLRGLWTRTPEPLLCEVDRLSLILLGVPAPRRI